MSTPKPAVALIDALQALPRYAFDERGEIYGPVDADEGTFVRHEDIVALLAAQPEPPEPSVHVKAQQRLERLASDPALRQAGWDSYDADPLDERAVVAAREFLRFGWQAVPTNCGGIQVERHDSGLDIEVEWKPDGQLDSVFVHAAKRSDDKAFICLDFDELDAPTPSAPLEPTQEGKTVPHNFHAIIGPNGMCECGVKADGTVVTCGALLEAHIAERLASSAPTPSAWQQQKLQKIQDASELCSHDFIPVRGWCRKCGCPDIDSANTVAPPEAKP